MFLTFKFVISKITCKSNILLSTSSFQMSANTSIQLSFVRLFFNLILNFDKIILNNLSKCNCLTVLSFGRKLYKKFFPISATFS